jgi:hypothetical protein
MKQNNYRICSLVIALALILVASPAVYSEDRTADEADLAYQEALAAVAEAPDATIYEILATWGPEIEAAGGSLSQLETMLDMADATKLLGALDAGSLDELGEALAGKSIEEPVEVLGDLTRDYVYAPVSPCRIIDTRNAGGFFNPGERREYYVYGPAGDIFPQGGNATGCPAPRGEPRGVHINVTSVPVSGTGNFKAFPANENPPNASLVNYRTGVQNIANAATLKTYFNVGPKEIEFQDSFGSAHLIVDVLGYYYDVEASLNEAAFSGYDIASGTGTVTTTSTSLFQFFYPADQDPNTSQISLSSSDRVLVTVSANVYRSGGSSNAISGTITPCYATTGNSIVESGSSEGDFQGQTDFYYQSTGSTDQSSVQASYLFQSVPSGTYRFGICATRYSSFGTAPNNYTISAAKVVVIKLRP